MVTIERLTLENIAPGGDRWDGVAATASGWARDAGIGLRDAVVLLPFAQLLPPARRAFARAGGWQPRIETTRTLAANLGPASAAQAGQITFDAAVDALNAALLLRQQTWGAAWARRDARGFEQATLALTATAHALARAAFTVPPDERIAHWASARELLGPLAGPGATERLLARVALEWASFAPAPVTDRLFAMPPPSAWIVVRAGGPDALTDALLAQSTTRSLVIDADAAADIDPYAHVPAHCAPALALCDDFEHEAQCAAAQVLAHVRRDEVPVALIAQDRVLVRRVRALLERQQVALLDETGWKLSTTRAAAQVMGLLTAARADASTDALLDWLKGGTDWARANGDALAQLEGACRRKQIARVATLAHTDLVPAAERLATMATQTLAELTATPRLALGAWLLALARALERCGAMSSLQADDAGRQVLAALRLAPSSASAQVWSLGASQVVMNFDAFRSWTDGALEHATFIPPAPPDAVAQVVITPLARAMLRPFAAVVLPGADDRRLGAVPAPDPLLGDALAGALGVPTLAQRRHAELLAFVQLLAVPRLTLTRRRIDGADPLGDSPLVERLSLALAARGATIAAWHDPRIAATLAATPIRMSAPSAAALLPARVSASQYEALRACPYRYFALHMLKLRENDELEREIEKRDYGSWLHAVLYAFHETRAEPAAAAAESARLTQLAEVHRVAQDMADADFLPFAASFASFAPRYVAWLHARDREGMRWQDGEVAISILPAALTGTEMYGEIDRIDDVGAGATAGLQLIDYKTGSVSGLKDKVSEPLEDTQLAFYAALMRERSALPLSAIYLAVDGTRRIDEVRHANVDHSAAALVDGLAHDLGRLRAGAGMPALGVGVTCDYCAARGICRRDHWAEA